MLADTYACSKYSFFSFWFGLITLSPFFHFDGQPTPFSSEYWKAVNNLRVSSSFLPAPKSLYVACLRTPLVSIIKVALLATPASGPSVNRHPYILAQHCLIS